MIRVLGKSQCGKHGTGKGGWWSANVSMTQLADRMDTREYRWGIEGANRPDGAVS